MMKFEKVKRFNLFKEDVPPDSDRPGYKNGRVIFDVALPPGRYSFSGWAYTDTGNISLEIQRVTEIDEASGGGGGFDD
jgi:hypothetical protein